MLLRVQSPEGTKRVEVQPDDSLQTVYKKACAAFGGVCASNIKLYHDRQRKKVLVSSGVKTVKSSKLAHGEMIYLHCSAGAQGAPMDVGPSTSSASTSKATGSFSNSNVATTPVMVEDSVDQLLCKEDGRIPGKRNPVLCRHKGNSRCIHCTDIDPWDEGYLKENNIKHMSFHTYLNKLKSGVDKGKFVQLRNLECSIKAGCSDHPAWPQGICSSCQPSAVTLTRQTFRHVDAVIFENRAIVENFLVYWRTSSHQRAGLLFGRHVPHREVPLGIRAEIAAIYEPPQEATQDNIKILPDPNKEMVEKIAGELGLVCCGWVFTDLVPLSAQSGTVRHLRHSETYFLSSHEVMTAAWLQAQYPNPCTLAKNGIYGSKFATVIVTGDENNQVHMEGYQVSHQCEALVAAGCLLPTLDAPELAYVKESSVDQYVPDVLFKEKDEYGNEVTRLGRPLPVEYLLLDLPVSTPNAPTHTFTPTSPATFPMANRLLEGHLQDFPSLARHLGSATSDAEFLKVVSDLHVLLYLAGMDVLPLAQQMTPLLQAVKDKDEKAAALFRKSDTWRTLEQLLEAAPPAPAASNGVLGSRDVTGTSGPWTCVHCTFINTAEGGGVCDMCHLPR